MNRTVEFAPYPLVSKPVYSRWFASALALVSLLGGGAVLLRSSIEPRLAVAGLMGGLLTWAIVFMVCVLRYRFNRHNAQCYADATQQAHEMWWEHHRQKAALVESVLVSTACSSPEHVSGLLGSSHQPPALLQTSEGTAIRLLQVFARDVGARERELAVLLALQWQAQRTERISLTPLCCYWQGSLEGWQAFTAQLAQSCPEVCLPENPEPWQGLLSLDSIIDKLQRAPLGTRVLCAGCHSSPVERDSRVPAGEAAVLWLLGSEGGVRLSRGEWFVAGSEELTTVAERALEQSEVEAPTPVCVSFSQPDVPNLSVIGWNTKQFIQDTNFGALANLEAMVVMTLAAWYAEQNGVPCSWLATDPNYTLTLGVTEADDSSR